MKQTDEQFKANLESITFEDIQAYRAVKSLKVLEVSSGGYVQGFMLASTDGPTMVAVRSIRDGIAKLEQRVGLGKLYASSKAAEKALKTIKQGVMS